VQNAEARCAERVELEAALGDQQHGTGSPAGFASAH